VAFTAKTNLISHYVAKIEKLDDIGVVGQQDKKSASSRKHHQIKTGEVFRRARAAKKKSTGKRTRSKSSI
jgi:hypothetical protein